MAVNINLFQPNRSLTDWYVETARLYWASVADCPQKTEWTDWYSEWKTPDTSSLQQTRKD